MPPFGWAALSRDAMFLRSSFAAGARVGDTLSGGFQVPPVRTPASARCSSVGALPYAGAHEEQRRLGLPKRMLRDASVSKPIETAAAVGRHDDQVDVLRGLSNSLPGDPIDPPSLDGHAGSLQSRPDLFQVRVGGLG